MCDTDFLCILKSPKAQFMIHGMSSKVGDLINNQNLPFFPSFFWTNDDTSVPGELLRVPQACLAAGRFSQF